MLQLRCGLCEATIDPTNGFFRASGDFLAKSDSLRAFVDAPMHWECYESWKERPRFAREFVTAWVKANRRNPFWWFVHQDEQVYVSANPMRSVEEVSVRLLEIGSDIRVPLPKWSAWLKTPSGVTPRLTGFELRALERVLPALRARFPNDHALVDAIDPGEKTPRAGAAQSTK